MTEIVPVVAGKQAKIRRKTLIIPSGTRPGIFRPGIRRVPSMQANGMMKESGVANRAPISDTISSKSLMATAKNVAIPSVVVVIRNHWMVAIQTPSSRRCSTVALSGAKYRCTPRDSTC